MRTMIRFLLLVVFVVVAVCVPESVSPLSYGSTLAAIPVASKVKRVKRKKTAAHVYEPAKVTAQLPRTFRFPSYVRFIAPTQLPGYYRERGVELYLPFSRYLTASLGAYTLSTKLAPPSDPLASQYMFMARLTVPF